MLKEHQYKVSTEWTGNSGEGTINYQGYDRSFTIRVDGKPVIEGSSDPSFRGDKQRHNPEELLVASLSSCHMLWYLHLCAEAGIIVMSYVDNAKGTMIESGNEGGKFKEVILHPVVEIKEPGLIEVAHQIHSKANQLCFIARSMNFPVLHEAIVNAHG